MNYLKNNFKRAQLDVSSFLYVPVFTALCQQDKKGTLSNSVAD